MEINDLVEVTSPFLIKLDLFAGRRGTVHWINWSRGHKVGGRLIVVRFMIDGAKRDFDIYENDLRVVTELDLLAEVLDAPTR